MKAKILRSHEIEVLNKWWKNLNENRGDRALLRRAQLPDDVLLTPVFARFVKMMPNLESGENVSTSLSDYAMVVAVLARVKKNNNKLSFAESLGGAMSELRFQQLQKSRTEEEFFIRICRAVNLLKGEANVIALADDILNWLAEQRFGVSSKPQERLAIRWATDYYKNN